MYNNIEGKTSSSPGNVKGSETLNERVNNINNYLLRIDGLVDTLNTRLFHMSEPAATCGGNAVDSSQTDVHERLLWAQSSARGIEETLGQILEKLG